MNNLMTKSFLDYTELRKQALKDKSSGNRAPDLEAGALDGAGEHNLSLFFQEVAKVTSEINDVSALLLDLHRLHRESKSTHSAKLLRGIADQMESDMVAVLRKAAVVKSRLEALDFSNASNRRISPAFAGGSPVDRTRVFVTAGVRTKLRVMMNEFRELREQIAADHREELRTKFFATTGEVPDDEALDGMIQKAGPAAAVGCGRGEMENEKKMELEERGRAVEEIQRSLSRLQGMFLDMAAVVEAQGEELNDIEGNVTLAKSFVNGGTGDLAAAWERKKKGKGGRVWCCALAAAVMVVFVVLSFIE
ncbi:Syntaxin-112 [Apostasia shenzhenica]|uniref:Syntaxin-112 n=1 Tax=Apostasia shenzhenica TaxID=1088818 RepID=A0A2I0AEG2_9ASPA|nr:Syntaxin-112 [Apostasia shenzhenica]